MSFLGLGVSGSSINNYVNKYVKNFAIHSVRGEEIRLLFNSDLSALKIGELKSRISINKDWHLSGTSKIIIAPSKVSKEAYFEKKTITFDINTE